MEDYIYQLKNLYANLPAPIRSSIGSLYGLVPLRFRYGTEYEKTRRMLFNHQFDDIVSIDEKLTARLLSLTQYCVKTVPFYRDYFSQHGYRAEDVQNRDDFLRLVPVIDKLTVQKDPLAFVSESAGQENLLKANTGGSTGIPLQLYFWKNRTRAIEHAFIHDLWSRVGYRHRDSMLVVRGFSIPTGDNLWYFDATKNRLVLSSYHLNEETLPRIFERLERFGPKFLHVYPSALVVLTSLLKRQQRRPTWRPRAILAGSEVVTSSQRKILEEFWQCRVFSWYGLGEMVAFGGECEDTSNYHLDPNYAFVEFLPTIDNSLEIVGSSFTNQAMPLMRYRTGDLVSSAIDERCSCGRSYKMLDKVLGRKQELVVGMDGSLVTLTALVFGLHHQAFERIQALQVVQERPGIITLRISKLDGFSTLDEDEIRSNISQATREQIVTNFEYHADMLTTDLGKHRFLIQELDVSQFV